MPSKQDLAKELWNTMTEEAAKSISEITKKKN